MSKFSIYFFSSLARHSMMQKKENDLLDCWKMELFVVTLPRTNNAKNYYWNCSAFPFSVLKLCWHVLNIFWISLPTICSCSLFVVLWAHIVIEMMFGFSISSLKAKSIYVCVINSKFKFNIAAKLSVSSLDGFHGLEHLQKTRSSFMLMPNNHKQRQAGWHIRN